MIREPKAGGGIVVLLLTIGIAPAAIWEAWVLRHLWVWFLTPIFGIAAPGLAMLVGLTLIAGMLTFQNINADDERGPWKILSDTLGWWFFRPLLTLLIGWIAWKCS